MSAGSHLRGFGSPIKNEFNSMPVLGQWLDIMIFLSYMTIPAQLILLVTKPPVVMDHRKLTSTFSSTELFRTRLLLIYFAMFIIFCGLGHGITAMCAASPDSSTWCVLVVPGKMAIALASGATSVMLLMWMPSLVTWMQAVEIHRRGFTQVVVNELSSVGAQSEVSFASVMHVQELEAKVERLKAELATFQSSPTGGASSRGRCPLSSSLTWWYKEAGKVSEEAVMQLKPPGPSQARATVVGYQRVPTPGPGGHGMELTSRGGASSSTKVLQPSSAQTLLPSSTQTLSISFAGPLWSVHDRSQSFQDLLGSCNNLQQFASMLVEERTFMGQAHAAMGTHGRHSKLWRRSITFEVTITPPGAIGCEYRADCAVKAVRVVENGKDLDLLNVWLWGIGKQHPREARPQTASVGSRAHSLAGSTSAGTGFDEDQNSQRLRPSVGEAVRREKAAFTSIHRKLPDLEDYVVQAGKEWRCQEMPVTGNSSSSSNNGEKNFRQALARLDIARVCLGMQPLLPRLHFERRSGITEVRDTGEMSRGMGVDLLAASALETWLARGAQPGGFHTPMRGVALVAQQAADIYVSVTDCTVQRTLKTGEVVVATGQPQESGGVVLVPIEKGAVQVGHFAVDPSTALCHQLPPPRFAAVASAAAGSRAFAGAAASGAAFAAAQTVHEDAGRSSGSSTDQEDEQLHFRLGLLS